MFGLFGKKVACFQCDKKTKEKDTIFRRGFRFCSPTCVDDFLVANPLKPREGDEASWRADAEQHIGLAYGEMASIVRVSGGNVSGSANVAANLVGGITALQSMEAVQDAFARYNMHVLNALPLLYGLGRDSQCAALESQDLDALYDLSAMGAGPVQMRKVRQLTEPVAKLVLQVYESLSDG
jgi:hypothetical protein